MITNNYYKTDVTTAYSYNKPSKEIRKIDKKSNVFYTLSSDKSIKFTDIEVEEFKKLKKKANSVNYIA